MSTRPDSRLGRPLPGQTALVSAGLTIGVILMGIQLWLLTVALDLFLAGRSNQVWQPALVSGAIFAGGLFVLRLLQRRPHVRSLRRGGESERP